MARLPVVAGIILCLLQAEGLAGTARGAFTVGIVIGQARAAPVKSKLRYTWGAAAISLRRAGYENPRRIAAAGDVYWFEARRAGARFRVAVWIATGRIAAVRPA